MSEPVELHIAKNDPVALHSPKDLITDEGAVQYGLFAAPPEQISFNKFDWRNAMDNPIKGLRKRMAPNQFQFIGLTGPNFILGAAIVNLNWVSKAFVYVYDPITKEFEEFSWLMPFALQTQTSNQPNAGTWSFKTGNNKIEMQAVKGKRTLKMDLKGQLVVDVTLDEASEYNPLPVCCRAGYNGWVFTNKVTARDFSGQIQWHGRNIETANLLASVDWSCGFMRRETFWNWASLSHQTDDGIKVGFNLANGVNETGDTENGLWINDQLIKLDRVYFEFDRSDREKTWKVKTSDGKIDLTFEPEGTRKEKINAVLLASNFTQVFGRFYGHAKDINGNRIEIDGAIGFCEDHYAKW